MSHHKCWAANRKRYW